MQFLKKFFSIKDVKSKTVLHNAFFSFFIKGLNICINFLTIPLVLTFLNNTQYGIWLTLTAILGWFSLFDLGFGNGLRNNLTIAITNNDFKEGRIYVSTTYVALALIFGTLIVVFLCIHPFINWTSIFNAPKYMTQDINAAVLYAMCFLFVQFVVRLITTVLLSFQKAASADFANALVQVFILIGLYLLKIFHYSSIKSVAIVYSLTPVLIFLIISFILFNKTYKSIRPSIILFRKVYVTRMLKLGLNFFIIQIAALVLYASDNFIITQFFSPADVTVYNIAFKYFSIITVLFTIVISPFWSMVTKSHTQGDLLWIKKAIKNLLLFWLLLSVGALLQLYLANTLYKIWTNNKVIVPYALSVVICLYAIATTYGSIFSGFLNGVGKIRVQLYIAVTSMVLNIPFAILLVKYFHLGIIGIPIATTFTVIVANIIISIQYKKIVTATAHGLWNK